MRCGDGDLVLGGDGDLGTVRRPCPSLDMEGARPRPTPDGARLIALGVGEAVLVLGRGVPLPDMGGGAPATRRSARATPASEITAPIASASLSLPLLGI